MADAAMQSTGVEQKAQDEQGTSINREWGWRGVFVFAFCSIGLTFSGLIPFSTVAGLYPGSNLFGVITVGAISSLILAYLYSVIGTFAPRYGADYDVVSRVIHPSIAYASSVVVVVFLCIAGGMMIASVVQNTLPMFTQILSMISADRLWINTINSVVNPNGVVLVGTVGLVIIFLMLILPPRITRRILAAAFILSVVAWGVLTFQLASVPAGSFGGAYEAFYGQGSLLAHIESARGLGMELDTSFGAMVSAGLIMGLWIFNGYFYPVLFAGDVKRPQRNLLLGTWSAIIVVWALLGLVIYLVLRQIPVEWLAAESFLNISTSYRDPTMPWLPFFGAVLNPNPALVWLLGLIWVYTVLAITHSFLYAASRIVFAWAEDKLLPSSVTYVHPILRSPVLSVLSVCLLALFGLVDTARNESALFQFQTIFFIVIIQVVPILAVVLLPVRRPEWLKSAPRIARLKIGPVPIIMIIGSIALVYLLAMVVLNYVYHISAGLVLPTIELYAFMMAVGFIVYFWRRHTLKAQGEDLDALLKRLPDQEE